MSARNKELVTVARGMGKGVEEMAGLASTPVPEIDDHKESENQASDSDRLIDEL